MKEPTLIIEPGGSNAQYWRDLFRYRELFLILAWRDVAVRYKQTAIGILWAVLRPFLTMIVFTIVFGKLAKLPSEGKAPYALMVLAGMLPWYLVSSALGSAADSITLNGNLIGKIYFPRVILPAATILAALLDFLISLLILFAVMFWYQFAPGWQILLLPIFVSLALLASLGPGLWLTALNLKYRDFRFVIPFLVQLGSYVSPVGFSSTAVPERWRLVYSINPLVGIIDGFRWCILQGETPIYWPGFILGLAIIGFFMWFGITRFRRTEKAFADLI